jgi:hypothetical protein
MTKHPGAPATKECLNNLSPKEEVFSFGLSG